MDDIHPKQSLKDLLPKENALRRRPRPAAGEPVPEMEGEKEAVLYIERGNRSLTIGLWLIGLILLLGVGYYLSSLFSVAYVTITPRQETVTAAKNIIASKSGQQSGLAFSLIKVEGKESARTQASSTEKISTKARGQIAFYNNFSSAAQTLVAGTRVTDLKTGQLFYTEQKVVVPGRKADGTAGSVLATISAAAAGSKANVGKAEFRIVAFAGTSRYDKIYAKATGVIGGGEVGERAVLSPAEEKRVTETLKSALEEKLADQARYQIDNNFVLLKGATFLSYNKPLTKRLSATGTEVEVELSGSLNAVVFNQQQLAQSLASLFVSGYEGEEGDVDIFQPEGISLMLHQPTVIDFEGTTEISFSLEGDLVLLWQIDLPALKNKLAATSVRQKNVVFQSFPEIKRAELKMRPPWVLSFPAQAEKIIIELFLPSLSDQE